MAVHLLRDLEKLKKEILLLGSMVESSTQQAVLALKDRRADLAREVDESDKEVDQREIKIEEDCLKLLALHQPVANDLRFVITVLKVNNDLERVGDLAGNLADRAVTLASKDPVPLPEEVLSMADSVPCLLRRALDSLIQLDTEAARQVLHDDEEVDETHRRVFDLVENKIREQPDNLRQWIEMLSVSRYLERIADLATNIAEDVIFLVDGDVVRHRHW
ncbi:MAG: phosphate signaling complex protein PhoU [Holophagales bacterium]|nr:phosphate signaling complex protein PhoU [Holophagales bacterium]